MEYKKTVNLIDKWKTTEYQHHKYIDTSQIRDKSKYYAVFYSRDLSKYDECGSSLIKFDSGEVTCIKHCLVHIYASESTIWGYSHINTALPRTRLTEYEKKI